VDWPSHGPARQVRRDRSEGASQSRNSLYHEAVNYRRRDCDEAGRPAHLLVADIETLRKDERGKWKAVDRDYPIRGWE
jgi:hypothetical protein